jgi:heme/copper-type cytochrome/quinol oxidase subunit 3
MQTRSILALAAAALAALAGVIASLDGDADIVPFFFGLTLAGSVGAWAVHEPFTGPRRRFAQILAIGWLLVALFVGGLLVWSQALCACSYAPRPPETTYLGLTATVYHLAGVFFGGALMVVAAFSRALGPGAPERSAF